MSVQAYPFFFVIPKKIGMYELFQAHLSESISTNGKGLKMDEFLKQIFAFFIDGTDMSISGFDNKKIDKGYAALLETEDDNMPSSHQIKKSIWIFKLNTLKCQNQNLHGVNF